MDFGWLLIFQLTVTNFVFVNYNWCLYRISQVSAYFLSNFDLINIIFFLDSIWNSRHFLIHSNLHLFPLVFVICDRRNNTYPLLGLPMSSINTLTIILNMIERNRRLHSNPYLFIRIHHISLFAGRRQWFISVWLWLMSLRVCWIMFWTFHTLFPDSSCSKVQFLIHFKLKLLVALFFFPFNWR